MLIGAVLTQNTTWVSAERAIDQLRRNRALTAERIVALPEPRLATIIRPAGTPRVKACRLKSAVAWLVTNGGFDRLAKKPTEQIRHRMLSCHGLGPETADAVLLYALNRPVFVIDAYTRRLLSRYGLGTGREDYASLQAWIESRIPRDPDLLGEFHALVVRLCKVNCRAAPVCLGCPLA